MSSLHATMALSLETSQFQLPIRPAQKEEPTDDASSVATEQPNPVTNPTKRISKRVLVTRQSAARIRDNWAPGSDEHIRDLIGRQYFPPPRSRLQLKLWKMLVKLSDRTSGPDGLEQGQRLLAAATAGKTERLLGWRDVERAIGILDEEVKVARELAKEMAKMKVGKKRSHRKKKVQGSRLSGLG